MKRKQIQQFAVLSGGMHFESAHALGIGLTCIKRRNTAQARNFCKQLCEMVGCGRVVERSDHNAQATLARHRGHRSNRRGSGCSRRRSGSHCGRCHCGGHLDDGRWLNRCSHRRPRTVALRKRPNPGDQFRAIQAVAAPRLAQGQQLAQHIAGVQQGIDHGCGHGQLMATQLVEQRLHHMGEIRHILKSEGGRSTLDGVRTAEDRIERLVIGTVCIQSEQQGFHVGQVVTGLLEKHIVELREIELAACALVCLCVAHHVFLAGPVTGAGPCRSLRSAGPGQRV